MTNKNALQHYLEHYAEPEAKLLQDCTLVADCQHVVIIPAYDESPAFLERLAKRQPESVLVILVVNRPDMHPHKPQASDDRADQAQADLVQISCPRNLELLAWLNTNGRPLWHKQHISLYALPNHYTVLCIDRNQHPLPRKQGVGLARKIAADCAIAFMQCGDLTTRIIHSTDADADLPEDYFQQIQPDENVSAYTYSFQHRCENDALGLATQCYQDSLHYYVNGLRWAGSPYAFHTIGSCLAVNAHHYCQVRGFPKRAGGEDFYLLNKLAKLAKVQQLDGKPIVLAARESHRVPFGTGPAVSKILTLESVEHFTDYNPRVFVELRQLLRSFQRLATQPAHTANSWLSQQTNASQVALNQLKIAELFAHLATLPLTQRPTHLTLWFDGFRTLKYIHQLEQHVYPAVLHSEAVKELQHLQSRTEATSALPARLTPHARVNSFQHQEAIL